jgi:hypothetical protein
MKLLGGDWSRGDLLALLGVVAAVLAIPGMPPILHWSKSAACRDPSHGIESFAREFDTTRQSPEMGGGHSQPEWCSSAIAALRGENAAGSVFGVVSSGEHTNNHCPPLNCPQYEYSCTIHVKADPIYVLKSSPACK